MKTTLLGLFTAIGIVIGFGLSGARGQAFGASFDCQKAGTPVEKGICADKDISTLDEHLASAYKSLLAGLDEAGKEVVKTEQRYWIRNVRGASLSGSGPSWTKTQRGDPASLKARYQQRIRDLDLKTKMAASGYTIRSGVYLMPLAVSPGGGNVVVETADSLAVKVIDENKFDFEVHSVGPTGNTCSLKGTGEKKPDGSYQHSEQADGLSCFMTFIVRNRTIEIFQDGCSSFCGAGADFPASFPLIGITAGK